MAVASLLDPACTEVDVAAEAVAAEALGGCALLSLAWVLWALVVAAVTVAAPATECEEGLQVEGVVTVVLLGQGLHRPAGRVSHCCLPSGITVLLGPPRSGKRHRHWGRLALCSWTPRSLLPSSAWLPFC